MGDVSGGQGERRDHDGWAEGHGGACHIKSLVFFVLISLRNVHL